VPVAGSSRAEKIDIQKSMSDDPLDQRPTTMLIMSAHLLTDRDQRIGLSASLRRIFSRKQPHLYENRSAVLQRLFANEIKHVVRRPTYCKALHTVTLTLTTWAGRAVDGRPHNNFLYLISAVNGQKSKHKNELTLVLLMYFYIHIMLMEEGINTPELSQVQGHLRTKFQWLHPCFRGLPVR